MFEGLLAVAILILSLVGLSEAIHRLWMFVLRPSSPRTTCVMTLLRDETAVQQLRAEMEQIRWLGKNYAKAVIAVDCGLPEEVAQDCKTIAAENSDVIYCTANALPQLMEQLKDAQYAGTNRNDGATTGNH